MGGGLASNKQIAQHIGYVTTSQVLPMVKAVTKIYKDFGFRDNRRKARLGHILEEWGKEKFIEVLHQNINFVLKEQVIQNFTTYKQREHFGIHESTQKSKSYIGCALHTGHIGAEGLFALHDLLKKYDVTAIKATTTQNFVIQDVPTLKAQALAEELLTIGVDPCPSAFKARTLACTGLNFCKFAISETKGMAKTITEHLEKTFPDFEEPISISVNGCPNSCAHPHIVDIGLMGCKVKENDVTVNGFELFFGGNLKGNESQFGLKSNIKFPSSQAPKVLEELIANYIKSDFNTFSEFIVKQVNDK